MGLFLVAFLSGVGLLICISYIRQVDKVLQLLIDLIINDEGD